MNDTLLSTLGITDYTSAEDNYNYYDGPAYDTVSIIFTIFMVITCLACCIKSLRKWCVGIFGISALALGINLMIRFNTGQCDYDPDALCGFKGGGKYPENNGYATSAQGCSEDCHPLKFLGITFIIIGGIPILIVLYFIYESISKGKRYSNVNTNKSSNRNTKVGCDCCYINV